MLFCSKTAHVEYQTFFDTFHFLSVTKDPRIKTATTATTEKNISSQSSSWNTVEHEQNFLDLIVMRMSFVVIGKNVHFILAMRPCIG